MVATLAGLLGVTVLASVVWSTYAERAVLDDLASRPDEQWRIAGLERSTELARHARWGITPWRFRRLRRRLDEAARFAEERNHLQG